MANNPSPQDLADIEEARQAYRAYLAHAEEADQPTESHPIRDTALNALHAAGKAMDYLGGNTRNTVAQMIDAKTALKEKLMRALGAELTPAPRLTQEGDTVRALTGNAPKTADYLERAGIPEGAHVSDVLPIYAEKGEGGSFTPEKGGALDPSVRGVAGFAGDVVLDPLTYLSGGLSVAAKGGEIAPALKAALLANEQGLNRGGRLANKLLNPVESLQRSGGKTLYKSAFDKADRKIETEAGKGSIGDVLWENDFKGSMDQATKKAGQIREQVGQRIGKAREQAAEAGVTQDAAKLADAKDLDRVEQAINELAISPEPAKKAEAEYLKSLRDQYLKMGEKDPAILATLKSSLRSDAGGSAVFKALRSPIKNNEDKLRLALADILNKGENKAVQTHAGEEAYQQFLKDKKTYGVVDTFGQKQLAKEAVKEANRTGIAPSAVDLMFLGAKHDPAGIAALAFKKARDITRMTPVRTYVGKNLHAAGTLTNGIEDEALRKMLWEKILKEQENRSNEE